MMGFMDVVWLFFLLAAVQPMLRQKLLETSRQRILARIERERNSRVILLVHRQETMNLLGFPLFRYIDIDDSEEVIRAIHMTDPEIPLDIVLHTPGGLVLAALQIARAIHTYPGKVTVFVPHYAMSGGTMIALSADEVIMDENAVLGPVDPQVGNFPAVSILKVLEDKPAKEIDDETMILADISRKAISQVKNTIIRLACCQYSEEKAAELAEKLASGIWTHDYPISFEEAQEMGLKVKSDMPEEIYKLMNLYPQARTRRPSVEFIPMPYEKRPAKPKESGNHKG